MNTKIFLSIPIYFVFSLNSPTQAQNKEVGFGNPLPQSSSVSSVFGEPRTNHFHSGIDFRTNRDTGMVVIAPYDGWVSRIKLGFSGYGKALYLDHRNGYSTVFGHLERLSPAIEKYIEDVQYANQKNDIEEFPEKEILCIQKGDTIGYTGNTGGSSGPHLHYEIRETKTQKPIDPLTKGLYYLPDNIAPEIKRLVIYEAMEIDGVNYFRRFKGVKAYKGKSGTYLINAEDINALPKRIALGIIAEDRMNNQKGTFAVASATARLNGNAYFSFKIDEFSFTETRYANAFTDYAAKKEDFGEIVKLFTEQNCPLSVYEKNENNGIIAVDTIQSQLFHIRILDHNGNDASLRFRLSPKRTISLGLPTIIDSSRQAIALPSKQTHLNYRGVKLTIPAKALYAPSLVEIKDTDLVGEHAISRSFMVGPNTIPLHKSVKIEVRVTDWGVNTKDRVYIARLQGTKGISYAGGVFTDSTIATDIREFGVFALARDTTPPLIKPKNFVDGDAVTDQQYLFFKIADEGSGIASYQVSVDGEWAAIEYEPKEQLLRYKLLSTRIQPGISHTIRIVCTDQTGNLTETTNSFIW